MTRFAIGMLIALFLISLIFAFSGTGSDYPPILSIIFHFLGGFFVTMLIASFYNSEFRKLPQYMRIFVIIAMTLSVGVIWEFLEYSATAYLTPLIYQSYHYYIQFIGDLDDTIQDLMMDTYGAIIFLGLYFFLGLNSKKKN